MTIERIKQLHEARPFHPFALHVADGRRIEVLHPEFLARSPSGRMIVVMTPDDAAHHLDLLLVTGIEVPPASNGQNGANGTHNT